MNGCWGVDRRKFLVGVALGAAAASTPDLAVDVFRDISAERARLLSTAQTSHATDRAIGALVAKDMPCVGSLLKWAKRGSPVLRVNSVGILAKVGSRDLDNEVVGALRADGEVRQLYLTAVASRVLRMPWDEAINVARLDLPSTEVQHVAALAEEIRNPHDSGARWCALTMLARSRPSCPDLVDATLRMALKVEPAREMVRSIGGAIAGLDPITL
jgi:hypothetical protein